MQEKEQNPRIPRKASRSGVACAVLAVLLAGGLQSQELWKRLSEREVGYLQR